MKKDSINKFYKNITLLIDGETIDFYASSVDAMFERICGALFKKQRDDEIWYDGTGDLSSQVNNKHEVVFKGTMNVMEGQKKHWMEPFQARVSLSDDAPDCVVAVDCGGYQASGKLYEIFGELS